MKIIFFDTNCCLLTKNGKYFGFRIKTFFSFFMQNYLFNRGCWFQMDLYNKNILYICEEIPNLNFCISNLSYFINKIENSKLWWTSCFVGDGVALRFREKGVAGLHDQFSRHMNLTIIFEILKKSNENYFSTFWINLFSVLSLSNLKMCLAKWNSSK